jgi:hypothetical protein
MRLSFFIPLRCPTRSPSFCRLFLRTLYYRYHATILEPYRPTVLLPSDFVPFFLLGKTEGQFTVLRIGISVCDECVSCSLTWPEFEVEFPPNHSPAWIEGTQIEIEDEGEGKEIRYRPRVFETNVDQW